jgi:hypothetical protein
MSAESAFPRALQELMRLQGGVPPASDKSTLILDPPSCSTWRYYLKYHPDKQRAKQLNRRFQARCAHTKSDMAEMVRKRLKSPDARAFMIITNSVEMERLQERLPADLVNDGQMYVGRGEQLVLRLKKASDTPASP